MNCLPQSIQRPPSPDYIDVLTLEICIFRLRFHSEERAYVAEKSPSSLGRNMSRKDDLESISQTRELLASVGLRVTAARSAVVRWLQKAKSPATHADIAADLVPLGFDKATVFRNLNDLVDAGVVSRTELGDRMWRFELRDPSRAEIHPHPHFVCIDCGRITCLHELKLPASAKKLLAQVGQVTEILMRGHCLSCS